MIRIGGGLAGLVVVFVLAVGCSSQKPSQHLSGKVTYRGKPVPAGTITFMPDSSKGNLGSATLAIIKDGQYDTSQKEGSGIFPGPNIVTIAGYDGKPLPKYSMGKQIFNQYQRDHDLPAGTASMDFTVPVIDTEELRIFPYDGDTE